MLIMAALVYAFAEAFAALLDVIPDPVVEFFRDACDKFADGFDRLHRTLSKKYRKEMEEKERIEATRREAEERFLWLCDHGY